MAEKIVESYLYELKPYVNTSAWRKASGDIDKALKSSSITYDEFAGKKNQYLETVKRMQQVQDQLKQVDKLISKASGDELARLNKFKGFRSYTDEDGVRIRGEGLLGEFDELEQSAATQKIDLETSSQNISGKSKFAASLAKFSGSITQAAGKVTAFIGAMQKGIETALELADKASQMANKLNTSGGFMDMGTRDTMARYGVDAVTANAMTSALAQMGLSETDLGRMTEKQREVYDELINHFQSGIDKIDSGKLEEFYETMDEFQLAQSKWKMDLQNSILKLFAESDSFKKLTGSLEKFFDATINFLESPLVQWFFDTFIEFLTAIVDFASWFLNIFNPGGSSSTTNNNNNSKNTYYIYGSDYASNDELARKIALETQSGGVG